MAAMILSLLCILPLLLLYVKSQEYDFSKDQDLVILLDRSQSMGSYEFISALDFLHKLMEVSMVIHPRFTRLALVTFDGNITTEFDHITSESTREDACELFGPGGAWSKITWVEGRSGRGISIAIQKAKSIFQVGRLSRTSKQILMLVGDGEWFNNDNDRQQVQIDLELLRTTGVTFYAAGLGPNLHRSDLMSLVSKPDTYYYQDVSSWKRLILDQKVLAKNVTPGEWYTVDRYRCTECGSGADCYCQQFSAVVPLCLCAPGFQPSALQCQVCGTGFYKDRLGNTSCISCDKAAKVVDPALKKTQCKADENQTLVRYILIAVAVLVIIVIMIIIGFVCVKCRNKKRTKNVACGEDQKNIYTQTSSTETGGSQEASATTTFDLINDIPVTHTRGSEHAQSSSYTSTRYSMDSTHIYDYVDENSTSPGIPVPEIVFSLTDSDSTSDKDNRKRSKNHFKNSKNKFNLHQRNKTKRPSKSKVKRVAETVTDLDYDTVLARFKRHLAAQKKRSSIETLERAGKVTAMVNMFEKHAQYVTATNALFRWQSEPKLPTAFSSQHKGSHNTLKRQNSYIEPVRMRSNTDVSSTTYASSSDEKHKTLEARRLPMRIKDEVKSSSESTDSDCSKHCTYLEVIRTPRPSSVETIVSCFNKPYANELLAPPLPAYDIARKAIQF